MHIVVALLLLAVAGSAMGGELVRYRSPDGSLGFVDDERRVPPGSVVLSRSPLSAPSPPTDTALSNPAEMAVFTDSIADGELDGPSTDDAPIPSDVAECGSYADRSDQLRCWRERGAHCTHFGMALRCAPADIAAAQSWCERGELLRSEQTPIEEQLADAVESLRACKSGARPGGDCPRDDVDEAERAAEVWDLRFTALEEQCQEQGCLPGWVRESCERSASR
jgi:hypothetical protein